MKSIKPITGADKCEQPSNVCLATQNRIDFCVDPESRDSYFCDRQAGGHQALDLLGENVFLMRTRGNWVGPSTAGKDMHNTQEWLYTFTPDGLAEIDECVKRLRVRGKPLEQVGATEFPFAALGPKLKEFKDEMATGRGFVILRGIPSERYTDDELGIIFWGFGAHFGVQMPQSFLGDRLGTVMDLTDEEPERTRRRCYHSAGAQTSTQIQQISSA